jgi:hypothetical protein
MSLAKPVQILRKANLTHDEFVEEYLLPLRPVILTEAIAHWVASRKWTPSFFREHYGSTLLTIDGRQHTMLIGESLSQIIAGNGLDLIDMD